MAWLESILDELAAAREWSYAPGASAASEPTALAALAMEAHGRSEAAERARRWLADAQAPDGSVGINARQPAPHWPTALAVLAWQSAAAGRRDSPYHLQIARALAWMQSIAGEPAVPQDPDLGHNTTLVGWPWVEGTHSWIEPTAWCLLAMKAAGRGAVPRAREAATLLIDRQLPNGGCNYGNTFVLGQELRPHLAPTGLVLLALAGETDASGRLGKSVDYVRAAIGPQTTALSLAYGALGLSAHEGLPEGVEAWLAAAAERTRRRPGPLPRLALLALAARGREGPIHTMCIPQTRP